MSPPWEQPGSAPEGEETVGHCGWNSQFFTKCQKSGLSHRNSFSYWLGGYKSRIKALPGLGCRWPPCPPVSAWSVLGVLAPLVSVSTFPLRHPSDWMRAHPRASLCPAHLSKCSPVLRPWGRGPRRLGSAGALTPWCVPSLSRSIRAGLRAVLHALAGGVPLAGPHLQLPRPVGQLQQWDFFAQPLQHVGNLRL